MNKRVVAGCSVVVVLMLATCAEAGLRVVINPWWPRAVVVAPLPLPVHPPIVVRPVPVPPPRPLPVPPPRPAPVIGYVDFNIRPGDADLWVDDVYRGKVSDFTTPREYMSLAAGAHAVVIARDGLKTVRVTVHVPAHKTVELDVTLRPQSKDKPLAEEPEYKVELDKTGYLKLAVEPRDAVIYVDNELYGGVAQYMGDDSLVLRAGSHVVEISRPGFKPVSERVEIASDGVKELNIKLDKIQQ